MEVGRYWLVNILPNLKAIRDEARIDMLSHNDLINVARQQLLVNQAQKLHGEYPQAAVLVAITVGDNEPSVILTQRADHMNIHPGESAFPGGKQDPEDESLLATALREANEEVGLLASDVEHIGQLDQQVSKTGILVSPFVSLVPESVQLVPNLNELSNIFSVPVSYLCNPDNLLISERQTPRGFRRVPHFEYGGYTVWGLTAIVLVDLVNTAFNAELQLS